MCATRDMADRRTRFSKLAGWRSQKSSVTRCPPVRSGFVEIHNCRYDAVSRCGDSFMKAAVDDTGGISRLAVVHETVIERHESEKTAPEEAVSSLGG